MEKQGLEEESRGWRKEGSHYLWPQREGRAGGGLLSLSSVSRGLLRSDPSIF